MNKLYISMYHYVRPLNCSRYPEIKGLDYELFREQIRFFKQNFHVVTMEEVLAAADGSGQLPEKALLLTFDDGYIDHFTHVFPILHNEGLLGSFFIPGKTFTEHKLLDVNKVHFILASAPVGTVVDLLNRKMDTYRGSEFTYPSNEELFQELAVANRFDSRETVYVKRVLQTALPERLRGIIASELFRELVYDSEEKFAWELYMNRQQIECMKKAGMFIGSHGYDHYWLGNLKERQMIEDIEQSLEILDGLIDFSAWVMNYPYGSYNEKVIECIAKRGCRLALTTKVAAADLDTDNRYELPRLDTNDFEPKSSNYLNY